VDPKAIMNRFQRRTRKPDPALSKAPEPRPALLFRCPGVHGSGCPDKAMMAFVLGDRPEHGITHPQLHEVCKSQGWALAAGKIPQPDGSIQVTLEPLCPTCEKILVQQMVDASPKGVSPSALAYVRKTLGWETPS